MKHIILFCIPIFWGGILNAQTIPLVDGNFDGQSIWGSPVGVDECCDPQVPGTSDLLNAWLISNGNDLYVGIKRYTTGSGTASYTVRFDLNCGSTSIDAGITFGWNAIGSNCTSPMPLTLEWTNQDFLLGNAIQGSPYLPGATCPDAGTYSEFVIDMEVVANKLLEWAAINPCECDCGSIRLVDIVSLAGGSFNSQTKDQYTSFNYSYNFNINDCPVADFVPRQTLLCLQNNNFFDASNTTDTYPQNETLNYNWNFGDGTISNGVTTTKFWNTAGTYNVSLTVNDMFGCISTKSIPVTVTNYTCPPLPVSLVYFSADYENDYVTLNWESEFEVNFSRYEIERASSNLEFQTVGTQLSQGPINHALQYEYNDPVSFHNNPIYYYRLKLIDHDGKYNYSQILAVRTSQSHHQISIYPNPATDFIHVELAPNAKGDYKVETLDVTGQIVHGIDVPDAQPGQLIRIRRNSLPKGVYFIKIVSTEYSETYWQKIVFQ